MDRILSLGTARAGSRFEFQWIAHLVESGGRRIRTSLTTSSLLFQATRGGSCSCILLFILFTITQVQSGSSLGSLNSAQFGFELVNSILLPPGILSRLGLALGTTFHQLLVLKVVQTRIGVITLHGHLSTALNAMRCQKLEVGRLLGGVTIRGALLLCGDHTNARRVVTSVANLDLEGQTIRRGLLLLLLRFCFSFQFCHFLLLVVVGWCVAIHRLLILRIG
mmetsp:Transcript_33344/g.83780  ORF Transcript_33344/g.83780 Transcript_33344/m.83780 type:complete len:222 (+) Transcript_33344:67-732(+)